MDSKWFKNDNQAINLQNDQLTPVDPQPDGHRQYTHFQYEWNIDFSVSPSVHSNLQSSSAYGENSRCNNLQKLAKFNRDAPRQWFEGAEAVFEAWNVECDKRRVKYVLDALDKDDLTIISNVVGFLDIGNQFEKTQIKYCDLKDCLIGQYAHSVYKPIRRQWMSNGGLNYFAIPSVGLSKLQMALHKDVKPAILRHIWLKKLVPYVSVRVAKLDAPLEEMAQYADRLMDEVLMEEQQQQQQQWHKYSEEQRLDERLISLKEAVHEIMKRSENIHRKFNQLTIAFGQKFAVNN